MSFKEATYIFKTGRPHFRDDSIILSMIAKNSFHNEPKTE